MFRKVTTLIVSLLLSFSALAQSERLYLDVNFDFDFDNAEYADAALGTSATLFGLTLMPTLRYEWNEKHTLCAGVNLQKWFGSIRFLDAIDFVAYYQFDNNRYGAIAGMFNRNKLIGRYSEAFFCNFWLADCNLMQGLALQYRDKHGFAELSIDWCGLYSRETREEFRVLFSGEGRFANHFYAGSTAAMHHYANRADFTNNVVDNITINPYIGASFNAFFDFDIRLGYLQTLQRDRQSGGGWVTPMGGELEFRMSRWGVFISNNLYAGKNLQPFYNSFGKEGVIYGWDLYPADPFYGTTTGIYNRTGIGYEQDFWKDRISVKAEMVLKTDGRRLYTQQIVSLGVKISPKLYDKANKTKKR